MKMMIKLKNTKWSGHTSASETRAYFPNPEKFSSWTRFHRVLAWICRFVENCKRKTEYRVLLSLTATEIHKAEMITVRKSQRLVHFDIDALRANKQLPVRSRLSALNPYVNEAECLRVGGRLSKALIPEETLHSLILHPKHKKMCLIVMHNHLRLYCASNKHVFNELRQKYWILKGLAMVQKILSSCPSCCRLRVKSKPPVMADLPDSRLGYQKLPFATQIPELTTLAQYLCPMEGKQKSALVCFLCA